MQVEMEFRLHPELRLALPRARQTSGWLTFGFGRSLDEAGSCGGSNHGLLCRSWAVPDGVIATANRAESPCDAIGSRLPA
jgi:hypothetical protein